jgi:hypothetical protein
MFTDVSEVRTASIIALMMEAVRTSETSVNTYLTTRQYIPEDSKLQFLFVPKYSVPSIILVRIIRFADNPA